MKQLIITVIVLFCFSLVSCASSNPTTSNSPHFYYENGKFYLDVSKELAEWELDPKYAHGSYDIPWFVEYDSYDEMLERMTNGIFTQNELTAISFWNTDFVTPRCFGEFFYDAEYPENCKLGFIRFAIFEAYQFDRVGSYLGILLPNGKEATIRDITQVEYEYIPDKYADFRGYLLAESDSDELFNDDLLTATDPDTGITTYSWTETRYHYSWEEKKAIETIYYRKRDFYTFEHEGSAYYVELFYKDSVDQATEKPHFLSLYGCANDIYFRCKMPIADEIPSNEWLAQFALKKYIPVLE